MAFPNVVQHLISKDEPASNVTTGSFSLPAGMTSGNTLVAFVTVVSGNIVSHSAPSGWSTIQASVRGANVQTAVFARAVDGTEGSSVSFTGDFAFRDALTIVLEIGGSDVSVMQAAVDNTSGQYPNAPSLTLDSGADDNLWIAFAAHGTSASTAPPPNYTLLGRDAIAAGDLFAGAAQRTTTGATEDPGGWTTPEYQSGVVTYILGAAPFVSAPSVTVTQATLTPGGTISGTYADYTTVPTTLTVSDGANTITIPSPTINDTNKTFSGTMPSLPATGTASLIQFTNSATVELT